MSTRKVAVVTGGSAGIGASTARMLVQQGYTVYNLDKTPGLSQENIVNILCDVADITSLKSCIANIPEAHIDVVVGNAGIHFSANVLHTSEEDFDQVIAINLKANFFLIQSALPKMLPCKKGSIILVGSDQSLIAKPNNALYSTSKAALLGLMRTTAIDFAKDGIRCNLVAPGTIRTPLYENAIRRYAERNDFSLAAIEAEENQAHPLGRIGTADEVANLICFLASDEAAFITGSVYSIDGGLTCQ